MSLLGIIDQPSKTTAHATNHLQRDIPPHIRYHPFHNGAIPVKKHFPYECGTSAHWSRRSLLKMAGLSGLCWLTPLATHLARASEASRAKRAKSLIVLWLEGAPSQLETFDPHPGTNIAAGSKARKTSVPGLLLGEGLEQTADLMESISLVRSVTSKEGDHERAVYNAKTGYRPDPTVQHPAIGSVICHQFDNSDRGTIDIPRHVSMMPKILAGRGGYLGEQYDSFIIDAPSAALPDMNAQVKNDRFHRRIDDMQKVVNQEFAKNRIDSQTLGRDLGDHQLAAALQMMSSDQLKAFELENLPGSKRKEFGNTDFGRACLIAVGLVETGVRCVEITLSGWDTHANNHQLQGERIGVLDPAYAALIRTLKERDLLDDTVVVCGGEFGRTPWMNLAGGRDHWPHGFSIALAGGGIKGGRIVGETSPTPKENSKSPRRDLRDEQPIENLHATIFKALGIAYDEEIQTPIGRPLKISEGEPIDALLA